MFPKLCLVFGIGVTENDPSAIFHSENGCFGIKDWREFGLAATQIWKKFEPHSPRDLAFDQTVLFDPAYFSFIGRTQLRQEDNALLDRISLMITKEGSSFALAPQPIANANRELVLSHGIRRLFREHSVEHIHDFFHELFEGGPDQSISDPVAARLTYYSLGQVALIDSDNSLILANCESDDHGTWLALIFPNAVEGLHDTTIFKKTLMELSDFLEISYGLGSYGESYRILPTHAHKLEDAPFSLSVLKSGSNWSFKD